MTYIGQTSGRKMPASYIVSAAAGKPPPGDSHCYRHSRPLHRHSLESGNPPPDLGSPPAIPARPVVIPAKAGIHRRIWDRRPPFQPAPPSFPRKRESTTALRSLSVIPAISPVIPAKARIHRRIAIAVRHSRHLPRHSRESGNPPPLWDSPSVIPAAPPSFPRKRESTAALRSAVHLLPGFAPSRSSAIWAVWLSAGGFPLSRE